MQASWPVFLVMVGLALASVWCWAVIIEKYFAVRRMNSANDRFEQSFWSGQSLEDLYLALGTRSNLGLSAIFMAAMREWKRSQDSALRAGFQGVQKRIEKVVDVQIQKEMSTIESRLLFLATTGAAAPFIGLFGTVWGIMTSFQAIANSQNTNLAVVAPGIAEALFATAIGLWPPYQRQSFTTCSRPMRAVSACDWRTLLMNSRRLFRASWMNGFRHGCSIRRN
jgi:biopolymer transport protein TolQ